MATETIEDILNAEEDMTQKYLHFVLKGNTPLLMHNPAGSMTVSNNEATRAKEIPTPEDEAEGGTYRDSKGNLAVPAAAVRNCILRASTGMRYGKKAAKPIISGSILLMEEFFTLTDEKGNSIVDYVIDTRRVVVQRAGIMRSRAKIETPWYLEGKFLYNPLANLPTLQNVFHEGGLTVGLLDYRIEKTGPFGSFSVEELEII